MTIRRILLRLFGRDPTTRRRRRGTYDPPGLVYQCFPNVSAGRESEVLYSYLRPPRTDVRRGRIVPGGSRRIGAADQRCVRHSSVRGALLRAEHRLEPRVRLEAALSELPAPCARSIGRLRGWRDPQSRRQSGGWIPVTATRGASSLGEPVDKLVEED